MTICGIYAIRHKASGKRYVGQTAAILGRWNKHLRDLRHNRHHNRYLQRAWNKHTEDAFEFIVLMLCPEAKLTTYEQMFMDECSEYNMCPSASSMLGFRHTEETKEKFRIRSLMNPQDGHELVEYIKEHGPWNKGKKTGPQDPEMVRRRTAHMKGHKFYGDPNRLGRESAKDWPCVVSPKGHVHGPIHNLRAFCIEHGIEYRNMWKVMIGERQTANGWSLMEK